MVVTRIKIVAEYYGLSERGFCDKVGIAVGFFNKAKSVGSEILLKISNAFPNVSAEWLLTGNGEMFRMVQPVVHNNTASNKGSGKHTININNGNQINSGNQVNPEESVEVLKARIAELEKDKQYLQMIIDKKL